MKKKEPKPIDESWMATYSDMVTLLLCFFVLLAGISTIDVAMFEQIQAGMNEGVGKKDVQRPIEMMLVELTDDIQSLSVGQEVSLGTDSQGVVLEFNDAVMFDYGPAKLREQIIPTLKRVAATLSSERYNSFNFVIEGHTSSQTFSSEQYPSNWELSSARAGAVARFFEGRGIKRVRLKAVGMYDNAPKYPNFDPDNVPIPQNMAKNRRVIVHIVPSFK